MFLYTNQYFNKQCSLVVCSRECGDHGCMPNGTCCHSACLGGCDGPSPQNCLVCKGFSFRYGAERTCMDSCPAGTYEVCNRNTSSAAIFQFTKLNTGFYCIVQLFRRCVTEQECRSMPLPPQPMGIGIGDSNYFLYRPNIRSYKIFNNSKCVDTCPSGFMEVHIFNDYLVFA